MNRRGAVLILVLGLITVLAILIDLAIGRWTSVNERFLDDRREAQERELARAGVSWALKIEMKDGNQTFILPEGVLNVDVRDSRVTGTFTAPGRPSRTARAVRRGSDIRWSE